MVNELLPAFSIILPVYNGEYVIEQCIQSLLNQSYQKYELIIIDDGSADNTQTVCKQYYEADNRINYHKQLNKGVSAARNFGLTLAQNEYILFVDADDRLAPSFLQAFSQLLLEKHVDNKTFVIQDYVAEIQFVTGKTETFNWCKFTYGDYSLAETFARLSQMNWLEWGVPFGKLYQLSIIREHGIRFNEQVSFREDLLFMLAYMQHVDRVIFDPTANYYYTVDKTKPSLSNVVASFSGEFIFFEYLRQLLASYASKFPIANDSQAVLNRMVYTSLFRCINSCMYNYKVPMPKQKRIENLRLLATPDNLRQLAAAGVIDTKMKQVALGLLKNKLFSFYDALNEWRFAKQG